MAAFNRLHHVQWGTLHYGKKLIQFFFQGTTPFFLKIKKTDVAENNKALFETRIILTFIF